MNLQTCLWMSFSYSTKLNTINMNKKGLTHSSVYGMKKPVADVNKVKILIDLEKKEVIFCLFY